MRAGCDHSLALTSTGLYAWGRNNFGQLGDGSMNNSDTPEMINFLFRGPPLERITSVLADCFHSLALTSHGVVLAWGDDLAGALGDGTNTTSLTLVSADLPAGTKVKSIITGCEHKTWC